jgi:ribulose-phosphate 3-epimerase
MIKLAPSILACNLSKLSDEILLVHESKAQYIHIDVMDGHFVPNITFGMPVIKSIRGITNKIFDVHLMIDNCEKYIEEFAECGADIITIHLESCTNLNSIVSKIKSFNKLAAVAIKPNTKIEEIYSVLEEVSMVLIMSVEPGFGGQKFIQESLYKAEKLSNYLSINNLKVDIEMDGGITLENAVSVVNSGVNILVAGSSVFKNNREETIHSIDSFYKLFKERGFI